MSGGDRARIWSVVRCIPAGRVATYGQVAALAGLPDGARQVGYALAALPAGSDVPWQRVVNARGEVSARSVPGADHFQRHCLEEEGGRIDLACHLWDPDAPPRRRPRR